MLPIVLYNFNFLLIGNEVCNTESVADKVNVFEVCDHVVRLGKFVTNNLIRLNHN